MVRGLKMMNLQTPNAPTLYLRSVLGRPVTTLQAALVLVGLTALIYANSLRNDFVFDDHYLISQNR
ncbi:MAG: hypothetical protein ACRDFW_13975, partial [bacterium]